MLNNQTAVLETSIGHDTPEILLVSGDPAERRELQSVFASDYAIREAEAGRTALGEIALEPPDLVLLSLDLPDRPGLDVLRALRALSSVPVVALSASDDAQRVAALDAGADDCVARPLRQEELLARARAILRRTALPVPDPRIRFGPIEVDLTARRVLRHGRPVKLTATEYGLLTLLISHPDSVLTHRRILRELWGPELEDQTHYLRTYMMRLRRKLGEDVAAAGYFQTESGVGYRFVREPG